MKLGRTIFAGVSLLALASAVHAASEKTSNANLDEFAPLSAPAGITLQSLGKFQGYGLDQESAALAGRGELTFADAKGMTVYTFQNDPPGKSTCVDACAKSWPPVIAGENARAVGDWSLVSRPDGSKQWALRGKPLYTYVNDLDPGSVGGNSPKRYGRGPHIGERGAKLTKIPEDAPLPDEWKPAMYWPANATALPSDFSVKDVQDATGLVLVSDANWTLYVFVGSLEEDRKACGTPCRWKPVPAPQMAAAKGDFVPVSRNDGIRQWTYKGLGLYTYTEDLAPGDANGDGVDKKWRIAHIARHFMPPNITLQEGHRLGKVLATAEGKTLYRRDSYIFQSGSGHGLRRGVLIRAAVGRDLGTEPRCVRECEKWHPFLAPADAKPQGNWDVYKRADGALQWAYTGYALWTYDGDNKPGATNGDDDWEIYLAAEQTDTVVDIGTPYDGVAALYWAAAVP